MNPYSVLGVRPGVSNCEVKAAFRAKALRFHPDRNPGDAVAEQSFKDVNEAYEVLKDDEKRAAFEIFNGNKVPGYLRKTQECRKVGSRLFSLCSHC